MEQTQKANVISEEDPDKFNPNKHVGTIYCHIKGKRVAVSDENLIPQVAAPVTRPKTTIPTQQ